MDFRALDEFDEEGRNDCRDSYFPKSIYFAGFGDIENCVQILCKKTILPLALEKWGFEVSSWNRVNTKVVGNDETNQMELKHEFSEYRIRPHVHARSLRKEPPKGPTNKKALKISQSYIKAIQIPNLT